MSKYLTHIIFSLILLAGFNPNLQAQKHHYLLHTDANIARLKSQIKNDPYIRQAWETQLQRLEDMLKRDRSGAPDLQ